jgi:uncharacterized membrane protein
MTQTEEIDELGPVDYIVLEFPGSKFNGQGAQELAKLEKEGLIRILDLVVIKKDDDGSLEAFELSDLDETELGGIRADERALAMLLSEQDVTALAETIEPGSSAGVLVWENCWAAPFVSAMRGIGGRLVSGGRIPVEAIAAVLEEDDRYEEEQGD